MGNVGGNRNFGFGKQMAWAGAQALRDRYGDGHYATVAAHSERWGQFADWAKATQGVRDARNVSVETVIAYGEILAEQVRQETMSVAYAQNLLSSVNVVLEALRGDRTIRISPAGLVGERSHVRDTPPSGLDRTAVQQRCAIAACRGPRACRCGRGTRPRPRAARARGIDARCAGRPARSDVMWTRQHHGRDQGWARPSRRPLGAGVRTGDGQSAPRGRCPRHQPKPHSGRDDLARSGTTTFITSGRRRGRATGWRSCTICAPPTRASAISP